MTGKPGNAPAAVLRNIEAVARLEDEAQDRRSAANRIADAIADFVGTVLFVALHVAVFAAWVAINLGLVPFVPAFDPYPFQLLCMLVSLEGVLLSTFVLIKQNRMSGQADRRAHLDLQVNLLSEKEITKVIQMLERVSAQLGIEGEVVDAETRELGDTTAVDHVARELRERLPEA